MAVASVSSASSPAMFKESFAEVLAAASDDPDSLVGGGDMSLYKDGKYGAKIASASNEMFTGKQGPMATGKMNQENLAKNQATGPKYSGKDYGTKNVQGTIEKAFGEVLRQATYQDQMTSMLDESSGKPQHELQATYADIMTILKHIPEFNGVKVLD